MTAFFNTINRNCFRLPNAIRGIVLLCVLLIPGWAFGDVVIVMSSEVRPYLLAAESAHKILVNHGLKSEIIVLGDLQNSKKDRVWHNDDIAVAIGSRAASYLQSALPVDVHLVYCMVADPARIGLDSGKRSIQGIPAVVPVRQQFLWIQQVLPGLEKVGVFYRSSSVRSMHLLENVRQNLPANWDLEAIDIDASGSVSEAIQEMLNRDVHLVWTAADSTVYTLPMVKSLLLYSLRNKVPVFGFSSSFVAKGALLGVAIAPDKQGAQAAGMVVAIVQDQETEHGSVSPEAVLAINMVVARRLSISIPDTVIGMAKLIGGH